MARKNYILPPKIFSFGVKIPKEWNNRLPDNLFELAKASNNYYNNLIDIQLAKTKQFSATEDSASDEIAKIKEKIKSIKSEIEQKEKAHTQLKIDKSSKKHKDHDGSPLASEIKELKSQKNKLNKQKKKIRQDRIDKFAPLKEELSSRMRSLYEEMNNKTLSKDDKIPPRLIPNLKEEILSQMKEGGKDNVWIKDMSDKQSSLKEVKKNRKESSLPCGMKGFADEAVQAAVKAKKRRPLKHKRLFPIHQKFGGQIQGNLSIQDIIEHKSHFFQIDPFQKKDIETQISFLKKEVISLTKLNSKGLRAQKKLSLSKKTLGDYESYLLKESYLKSHLLNTGEYIKYIDYNSNRSQKMRFTKVRINIGSKRREEYLELDVKIHRDLPRNDIIKMAWFLFYKIGNRLKCKLQLTIEPTGNNKTSYAPGTMIAWDLGWRGGDTCGHLLSSIEKQNGEFGELINLNQADGRVKKTYTERCDSKERLESYYELHFNLAKEILIEASQIDNNIAQSIIDYFQQLKMANKPQTTTQCISYIKQWGRHDRLVYFTRWYIEKYFSKQEAKKIWTDWRVQLRKPTKKDLLPLTYESDFTNLVSNFSLEKQLAVYLLMWKKKNNHLYQCISDLRNKTLLFRNNYYRWIAKKRASEVEFLVLEGGKPGKGIDLAAFSKAPSTTAEGDNNNRGTKTRVAPSILRNYLIEAFGGKNGGRIIYVNKNKTSTTCTHCGFENTYSDAEKRDKELNCKSCEQLEDRDYRSTFNMLERADKKIKLLPAITAI